MERDVEEYLESPVTEQIEGAEFLIPVGALQVKSVPRSENYPSLIVSDHDPEADGD